MPHLQCKPQTHHKGVYLFYSQYRGAVLSCSCCTTSTGFRIPRLGRQATSIRPRIKSLEPQPRGVRISSIRGIRYIAGVNGVMLESDLALGASSVYERFLETSSEVMISRFSILRLKSPVLLTPLEHW